MSQVFAARVPWGTSQTAAEPERDSPAPRWTEIFECPAGHEFDVQFAHDAELPETWECRHHGQQPQRLSVRPTPKPVKSPRTDWGMLLERRSIAELEILLDEALHKVCGERRSV